MTYDELVQYIRSEGCRVRVYTKQNAIDGARGTFHYNKHGPIICVATKGINIKKRVEALLHEYGHYLQWQDGFMQSLDDICMPYDLMAEWLNVSVELTDREIRIVRNMILAMEYDAERRAYRQGTLLDVEGFDGDYYLRGAAAYMAAIKWTFAKRTETDEVPRRVLFQPHLLSNEELFSTPTEGQLKVWGASILTRAIGQ